jgi:threonine/homoserine/homoserine lactone efflux protein
MFDARYIAFAALSALLVISPGVTLAVVVDAALAHGRRAALLTAAGVGLGNAALATATAFGVSALVDRWPSALHAVRCGGQLQPPAPSHPWEWCQARFPGRAPWRSWPGGR